MAITCVDTPNTGYPSPSASFADNMARNQTAIGYYGPRVIKTELGLHFISKSSWSKTFLELHQPFWLLRLFVCVSLCLNSNKKLSH